MFFVASMPWPVKAAIFTAATLPGYSDHLGMSDGSAAAPAPLSASDFRACYWALVVFTAGSVLPSLCFSVPSRIRTTSFAAQCLLMLFAIGAYMTALFRHDADAAAPAASLYACISMLVLSAHYLFRIFKATGSGGPKLLLYGEAVAVGACVLALALVVLLAGRLPAFRMHGVVSLCLLFLGEVLGLAVFVVDAVCCAIGTGVESACRTPCAETHSD